MGPMLEQFPRLAVWLAKKRIIKPMLSVKSENNTFLLFDFGHGFELRLYPEVSESVEPTWKDTAFMASLIENVCGIGNRLTIDMAVKKTTTIGDYPMVRMSVALSFTDFTMVIYHVDLPAGSRIRVEETHHGLFSVLGTLVMFPGLEDKHVYVVPTEMGYA